MLVRGDPAAHPGLRLGVSHLQGGLLGMSPSFPRRDVQIACEGHRVLDLAAQDLVIVTDLHVSADAGRVEDGMQKRANEPVFA